MFSFIRRRSSLVESGLLAIAAVCCGLSGTVSAQTAQGSSSRGDVLAIFKVDPPNWWATMPSPMLLVRGEGLRDAAFTLSDPALQVVKTVVSENGHWAQVWLSASPSQPETVTLKVSRGSARTEMQYTFLARRSASDGFAGFSSRDVMYLIMTDRFADGNLTNDGADGKSDAVSIDAMAERAKPRGWHGGDLRGITQHLDYLQALGVTAVWTTPVYQNHEDQSYHGYGATDLYAVDEHYGSLEDLKKLAADLHQRGMKLVLDTVPNHIGPAHPWVKDEPAPNWFHGTAAQHIKADTNFRALIDPHAPARDKTGTLEGWFADRLPDMDTDDPAVAQYLRQNAVWWIEETGADALRIDTFPYVNREFWNGFNGELKDLYPRLTEVGEVFNGDAEITSSFAGGVTRAGVDTKLTTPFDFPTYFALRNVFGKGVSMTKLADVLSQDALYPHPETLLPFFGNHDTTRFLDAAQGNLAAERLAFAYVMTIRGLPQIYSGDEIAMHGGDDPDNRHDFPGGFPGAQQNAFTTQGRTPEQQQMFLWVSYLAKSRRAHPALSCGAEQVLASGQDWIVYLRDAGHAGTSLCGASSERVLVAVHRGPKPAELNVPLEQTWMSGCHLAEPDFAASGSTASVQGSQLKLQLQPDDVLIAACR
jgi:glycosidase